MYCSVRQSQIDGVLDHQLRCLYAVEVVDRQPVGGVNFRAGSGSEVELDRVEPQFVFAQAHLEVLFLEDARVLDDEFILENLH